MLRAAALLLAVLFGISTYSQSAQAGSRNRSIAIGAGVLGLAIIAAGAQGERASHRKRQSSKYGNRSERKYGKQSRQSKKSRRNDDDDDAAASAKATDKAKTDDQNGHAQDQQEQAADEPQEKNVAREEPDEPRRARENSSDDDARKTTGDDRQADPAHEKSNPSREAAVDRNTEQAAEVSQEELAQEEADQPLTAPKPSIEWQGKAPEGNRLVDNNDSSPPTEGVEREVRQTSASADDDLSRPSKSGTVAARNNETGSVSQDEDAAPRKSSNAGKSGAESGRDRSLKSTRNDEANEPRPSKQSRNDGDDRPAKVRNNQGFDPPIKQSRNDANGLGFQEGNRNMVQPTRSIQPPQENRGISTSSKNNLPQVPASGVVARADGNDQTTFSSAADRRPAAVNNRPMLRRSANRNPSGQQSANTQSNGTGQLQAPPNKRFLSKEVSRSDLQKSPTPSRRPYFHRRVVTNKPQQQFQQQQFQQQQFQQQQFQQQRFQPQQSLNHNRQQTYRSWRQRF